ncbi:MAG: CDP-diacylglycerol--serine O-phosphatidyltransferase [Cytophagales bacterium]|nr:CDP-diacylglycerol--serine O-phosphatidyltransferase [Bernardetiaceae bacterium]MDW8205005.1 CDP-diacylglycerol--serine O-phosphatidyltransferase [Cytophagales bacterium]
MIARIRTNIPNGLTCANLCCGCLGVIQTFQGSVQWAAYLIYLAAFFDFADGLAARWLRVQGALGKELDSLADVISFGALPGFILFQLMTQAQAGRWSYLAMLVPIFSALRLAKFNTDPRQTDSFIGVPTPANALLISGLPFAGEYLPWLLGFPALAAVAILMSWLLVAELPLLALKFKGWSWQTYKFQYILIASGMVLLFAFKFAAIPLIVLIYIGLSVIKKIAS